MRRGPERHFFSKLGNQPKKGIFAQKVNAESELSHEISDIRPAPGGAACYLIFRQSTLKQQLVC
jgi:hypothetical protein